MDKGHQPRITYRTNNVSINPLCGSYRPLKIIAVTRRDVTDAGELWDAGAKPAKLMILVEANLENEAAIVAAWTGADVLFNALGKNHNITSVNIYYIPPGTTRSVAGSAAAFQAVEVGLTHVLFFPPLPSLVFYFYYPHPSTLTTTAMQATSMLCTLHFHLLEPHLLRSTTPTS